MLEGLKRLDSKTKRILIITLIAFCVLTSSFVTSLSKYILTVANRIDVNYYEITFAYYEKYSDETYGFHYKFENGSDLNEVKTIRDDKPIIEDGYCLFNVDDFERINKEYSVKIEGSNVQLLDNTYGQVTVDMDTGKEAINASRNTKNIVKIRNSTAENAYVPIGDDTTPRKVNILVDDVNYVDDNVTFTRNIYYNPLFSDTIYFDRADVKAYSEFNVRTPRNLDNIDKVNVLNTTPDVAFGDNGVMHSQNMTYTQTLDLNFADITATADGTRFKKDGFYINEENCTIKPNEDGTVVMNTFTGTYNGNKKQINNLMINAKSAKNVGIIEFNGGKVRNVTVNNAQVLQLNSGANGVSAIVQRNLKDRTVENCKLTGLVNIKSEFDKTGAVGGVVAINWSDGSTVLNCSIETEQGSSIVGHGSVGGFVGRNLDNSYIKRCNIAKGKYMNVSVGDGDFAGGIVGENHGTVGEGPATACKILGTVELIGNHVGGIAGINGFNNADGTFSNGAKYISNCSVLGKVVANGHTVGGVVGKNNGTVDNCQVSGDIALGDGDDSYIGGIAGINNVNVTNCDIGGKPLDMIKIKGKSYVGGIAGISGSPSNNVVASVTTCSVNAETNTKNNFFISSQPVDKENKAILGGAIGWNYGIVKFVYVLGKTDITSVNGDYIGGIAGINGQTDKLSSEQECVIMSSKVSGIINISGRGYIGGIAGKNNANIGMDNNGLFGNVNVEGSVKVRGTANEVGGVAGRNDCVGSIVGCIIVGADSNGGIQIVGKRYTGGVAGINDAGKNESGIVSAGVISGCTVDGVTQVGENLATCEAYSGGIAGMNVRDESNSSFAIIKECLIGSDYNYIKVMCYLDELTEAGVTFVPAFTVCYSADPLNVKDVYGYAEKITGQGSRGNFEYPDAN